MQEDGRPTAVERNVAAPTAGVVLVNYGSHELVERAAASVAGSVVVVVDNFSTQAEQEAVVALGTVHGWSVVPLADNRGFGAGCNAGVARAVELGCDIFVFLNPDAALSPPVVAELVSMVEANERCVVSPSVVDSDGSTVFAGARLNLADGRIRSKRSPDAGSRPAGPENLAGDGTWVPWLTGACFAIHRSLWEELGGFREPFFLYWEDVDITVRAFRAGASLVVRHDLSAIHDEGGTQGVRTGRAKSALYYDWNCRNRLRFAATTLKRREILHWMLFTPAVSWEILMRGGRRQLVESPKLLVAAARGTVIGLALAVRGLVRRPASTRGDALPVGGR